MKIRLFALCAFLIAGCASDPLPDFDNSYSINGDDKIIAFVGRKIAIVEIIEKPVPTSDDMIIIEMDSEFAARYEILELVHGDYPGKTIDFSVFDHYGYPRFAIPDVAMIYLVEHQGALYHKKYQWDEVHRTQSGRYAACGDRYFELDEEDLAEVERRPLETITFDPPVRVRIADKLKRFSDKDRYTAEEFEEKRKEIEAYFVAPAFDVKRGVATCKMGLFPDELYRIEYETVLRPAALRQSCEEEIGYTSADWRDQAKKDAVAACINEKRAKGLSR